MNRSVRRYQQRVAKARRVRILISHGAWASSHWEPKIWRQLRRMVLNEPGWWVHQRIVVPARTETRRLEHQVKQGHEPDSVLWPDFKKPHVYYW